MELTNQTSESSSAERPPANAIIAYRGPGGLPGASSSAGFEETAEGGLGLSRYLHALRRRWLISAMFAIPLAAGAAFAVWSLQPRLFTARALLRVSGIESPLIAESAAGGKHAPGSNLEIYKRTQRQLLTSDIVLNRALREGNLTTLPIIAAQEDPLNWLQQNVKVSFPDDSEILLIALAADSPTGLDTIINEIVKAYFASFGNNEEEAKKSRLNSLEAAKVKAEKDLGEKKSSLARLVAQFGSSDKDALNQSQRDILEHHEEIAKRLVAKRVELVETRSELEILQGTLKELEANPVVDEDELNRTLQNDAEAASIRTKLAQDLNQIANLKKSLDSSPNSKGGARRLEEIEQSIAKAHETHDARLAARREKLRQEIPTHKRTATSSAMAAASTRVTTLEKQLAYMTEKELAPLAKKATEIGSGAFIVDTTLAEVTALQGLVSHLTAEVEKAGIEATRVTQRVTPLQPATQARTADPATRITKSIGAGALSLLLPFALFVWLDARKDRISTGTEVAQGMGLSVIGSVPILPQRVMRRLNGPSRKDEHWRTMLAESVDSIAAVLLRGSRPGTSRVVMVSSANAGEGKTTLAAHLAVSLAGAGRHTILVDFDLRRPALHRVFGVSLQPGVNEILRDGQALEGALQATQIPNLMLLSSGRWSKTGLAGLAAADLKSLFDQLRAAYDFVLVDASPILPVVDTRLIGQHVDGVLLSVLRDVSRAPKLRAACDLLEMFGIPNLGVVVTGSSEELYQDGRYAPLPETQAV